MATFTEHLRGRGEEGLAALLEVRPDLAAPPPASVRALAARASGRASLDRALSTLDAHVLTVLEAVLALDGTITHPGGPAAVEVTAAVGQDARPALAVATDQALLWPDDGHLRACPGLGDVLGPYPAGLGPTLVSTLSRRSSSALAALADELGSAADDVPALAARLAAPGEVERLLADAPRGAREILDALTWGPPVGRSPAGTGAGRAAVTWLLAHGLLALGDPQHVVLPREVALNLRAGRTHADASLPPAPVGTVVDPRTVDAESALHAEDAVRLTAGAVAAWGREQPPVLRSGGLGSRELRKLATRLGVVDATAALVVETAASAGLIIDDGEDPPAFCPTTGADDWLALALPDRWAVIARAWLTAERAAWLVGTRDDRGTLRAALDPESRRPWAPRLRRSVLGVLAQEHPGRLTAEQVHDTLVWRTPRSAPPAHAVAAVLEEAELLGVLGAGALSPAGHALLDEAAAEGTGPGPAVALAAQLPPDVDEVLLQGDLTGVVPGRPSPALAALLAEAAHVESRGAGVTVRFTETSVRASLDTGRSAEDLLAALSRHARSGVPQPLEYLVLDAARRHGQVRAGLASSYLRGDPSALAGLVEDRALSTLGLLRLAPTVIVAQVPPAVLVAALRERGHSPVTEDPSGNLVVTDQRPRRVRVPRRRGSPGRVETTADDARARRLRRLAKDLLSADRRELVASYEAGTDAGAPDQGTPDPVLALALLRDAAAQGREVWLEVVGPQGITERRRVRPLRVDGGRVRAVDPEREAELTVAVHRIAHVTPIEGAG